MTDDKKPITVGVRLSPEQRYMLDELASHARRTHSDYIRILIEDEYADLMDAPKPPRK